MRIDDGTIADADVSGDGGGDFHDVCLRGGGVAQTPQEVRVTEEVCDEPSRWDRTRQEKARQDKTTQHNTIQHNRTHYATHYATEHNNSYYKISIDRRVTNGTCHE